MGARGGPAVSRAIRSRRPGSGHSRTTACTSAVLLIPLVAVAAASALAPLIRIRTALVALGAGGSVVVALSTTRLVLIALAWRAWGDRSLWVTHDLIGSLLLGFGDMHGPYHPPFAAVSGASIFGGLFFHHCPMVGE